MKRIANRMVNKDGKVSARYERVVLRVLYSIRNSGKSDRFHCKSWTGSNKHRQLVDNEKKFQDVLDALGIPFMLSNDAPRHGVEGDYIEAIYDNRNPLVKRIRNAETADIELFNAIIGNGK
jgi:hypothetical protein